jgi:hypothetical protein
VALYLHLPHVIGAPVDDETIKPLEEVRQEYMLRILNESAWDFRRASRILKVSEVYLKKHFSRKVNPPEDEK